MRPQTSYFITDPPLEEIEARVKGPRVQAVIKAGRIPGLRQPVYMVTGLMIAKGFAALQESGRHRAGGVEASGNIPIPAGDAGLGAKLAKFAGTGESDTWKAADIFLQAYQLLKIEVKGWKGTKIEYDELRHKAAYLSKDEGGDEDDEEDDEEDEIAGQVTPSSANVDNLPVSRSTDGNYDSGVRGGREQDYMYFSSRRLVCIKRYQKVLPQKLPIGLPQTYPLTSTALNTGGARSALGRQET